MKKFVIGAIILLAAVIYIFFRLQRSGPPPIENKVILLNMTITSPAFQNNGYIPKKFTCEGENVNPELRIQTVPENTKSLALIMEDPDAPGGTFVHWTVWNINPKTTEIKENEVPAGSIEGRTSADKPGYIGPCPPPGKPHRYFFKLYALDDSLPLSAGASKKDLETEIQKHLLTKAELVGLYGR